MSHRKAWIPAGLLALWFVSPSSAIDVLWTAPNAKALLCSPDAMEHENPLTGSETVAGYRIIEWRDADYAAGPSPWYDDWSVTAPSEIARNQARRAFSVYWRNHTFCGREVPETTPSVVFPSSFIFALLICPPGNRIVGFPCSNMARIR